MSANEYRLSCVLLGHSVDVRGLATTSDGCVVSASRDKTAKLWKLEGEKPDALQTFQGHENYVSCVCALPPSSEHPDGLVFSGSNDHTICAFSPTTAEVLYQLKGHQNVVCCLNAGSDGRLLSASWDSTARIWHGQAEVLKLEGHQATVWSVIQLPGSLKFVTASADKTIKVWNQATCEKTLTGHEDCVRGLAAISDTRFLSCANDATVRLWISSGECLGTFYGHSNYIYSVALLPNGGFVTSSEDHSVRVWKGDGDCEQVITLPAQSVWAVAVLPSGDIAAGSSDGSVRVFSKENERQACADTQEIFLQEVAAFTKTTMDELGGVKINELPGPEILFAPGTTDGQTKLVREGTQVFCYNWSAAQNEWVKVGDVVGASQQTEGRTSYKGKEYDFVFSVDIEEGKPPLKLPYNKGEDPWVAAQTFIHSNNLSQMFLDTIANFIVKNSGGEVVNPSPGSSSQYYDPFTGGSRYVPGSSAPAAAPSTMPNPDPFTGSSSYSSAEARKTAATVSSSLPVQKEYHLFEQANLDGISVKLVELSVDARQPLEPGLLEEAVKLALPGTRATSRTIGALQTLMAWPEDKLFPVLDLVRLAVRHAEVNEALCAGDFAPILVSGVLKPSLTPQAPDLTRLMALRLAANMLVHVWGEQLASEQAEFLVSAAAQLSLPQSNPSPRQQVAVATLLFNLSVAYVRGHAQLQRLVLPVAALTLSRLRDPEAQLRCLRAVGNLMYQAGSDVMAQIRDKKLPETLATLLGEAKMSEIAGQLLAIMP